MVSLEIADAVNRVLKAAATSNNAIPLDIYALKGLLCAVSSSC